MTMEPIVERRHIEATPGVCGGRPRISGTRVRVQDVYVWHERQGRTPDEIVGTYSQLTLADVYAALAYFWDHRDEILHEVSADQQMADESRRRHPPKLPDKLAGKDADEIPSG